MRITFTLFAMLLFAISGYSQEATYGSVSVKVTDLESKTVDSKVINVKDINQFDLSSYITENSLKGIVTAYGTYVVDGEQTTVSFSSKSYQGDDSVDSYCRVVEYGLKPILGVGVESTKHLTGVIVKRLESNSAAEDLGIEIGDVIFNVNNEEVNSWCDLRRIISQTHVGQLVPVEYRKDELIISKSTIIGGKTIEKVSFEPCVEVVDVDNDELHNNGINTTSNIEMSVYPNPTQRVANVRYTSDSDEPVKFFVMAMDGSIILSEQHQVINGDVFISYNFQENHTGAYQFVIQQADKVYVEQVQVVD